MPSATHPSLDASDCASPLAGAKPNSSSRSGPESPSGVLSLEAFGSDLVHGLLQNDDDIFERVYARDFSRDLDET